MRLSFSKRTIIARAFLPKYIHIGPKNKFGLSLRHFLNIVMLQGLQLSTTNYISHLSFFLTFFQFYYDHHADSRARTKTDADTRHYQQYKQSGNWTT